MKKIILLFLFSFLTAQTDSGSLSPVVTYWKTLTQEEKETFLFSYITQVYETHTELKSSVGYGGITESIEVVLPSNGIFGILLLPTIAINLR